MKKIGVLTSGGDSPGMNSAVVAIARAAAAAQMPLVGVKRGYNGLLRKSQNIKDDLLELDLDTVLDIADLPGTYLRTARCKEFLDPAVRQAAVNTLNEMDIGGLVVIGGDGSFQGAMRLCEMGIPCIGIPGTIDNDLAYTEMTLGYDTAVNVCVDAVRAIRATSRSHDRPAVVEVMGRHCGDIALTTAVATGAEQVLVPEEPWSVEEVATRLNDLMAHGNTRSTVMVAEGCWESMKPFDLYGYLAPLDANVYPGEKMDAHNLARVLRLMCSVEARATVLGYTQRGATPNARDSAFAFEAGYLAVQLLCKGISNQVIGVRNGRTFYMPIVDALKEKRAFNAELYNVVNAL
ncbi:MAG: ATP-dependent 6-phosphofructokinase [Eubacteriales bacterium]|nr:ATP-dependent 6-phosphofructokinase [Eubacteriales bacterium]MDD3881204.1 ATP-dependent 6-phosphofructokinase [Eubacteriales bacterium]MDD4511586.1 ATP-dependent 6-phosphofructokinase [Eubacteriales bacterium]